jgi:anti-sigma regulatory factor (Ser/Thr protein kinase)
MPKKSKAPLIITFPAVASRMAEVRAHTRNFLLGSQFDEEVAARVVMALDEACTNILRHVYCVQVKPVRLEMRWMRDRLRFTLRDYGKPCDPLTIKGRNWDDIRPGGLGVSIIQEVFDRVEYAPQARGTKLTLEKLLPPGPA